VTSIIVHEAQNCDVRNIYTPIVRLFTTKVEQLKCEKGQTDRQTITQNAKVEKS